MTDRVLTEEEVEDLRNHAPHAGRIGYRGIVMDRIIASHRLQAARIQELEMILDDLAWQENTRD